MLVVSLSPVAGVQLIERKLPVCAGFLSLHSSSFHGSLNPKKLLLVQLVPILPSEQDREPTLVLALLFSVSIDVILFGLLLLLLFETL